MKQMKQMKQQIFFAGTQYQQIKTMPTAIWPEAKNNIVLACTGLDKSIPLFKAVHDEQNRKTYLFMRLQ